jgi:hypothetical protein
MFSLVAGEKWPALKTTWGVNVFGSAFHDRPRTQVQSVVQGLRFPYPSIYIIIIII